MKEERLSMLEAQLLDEYFRGERHIAVRSRTIESLPKGYVTTKKIKGREHRYLQWREGKKIKSRYIKPKELPAIEEQIAIRKQEQSYVKRTKRDMEKIRRLLGDGFIERYRGKL